MNCPKRSNSVDDNLPCSQCHQDWAKVQWVLLGKFSPPNHLIISSLLQSQQIPFKTINQEIAQFPFSIGPLSETLVFVPDPCLNEARDLINAPYDSA